MEEHVKNVISLQSYHLCVVCYISYVAIANMLVFFFFAETTFSTDPPRLLLFGSMPLMVNPIRRKWVGSHLNVVAEHKRPPAASVSHSHCF